MEHKLCQKCEKTLGIATYSGCNMPLWWHCHHEEPAEKTKEKCWCEYILGKERPGKIDIWQTDKMEYFEILFCPHCGIRLTEKNKDKR